MENNKNLAIPFMFLTLCIMYATMMHSLCKKKRKNRRWWVRPVNLNRKNEGYFKTTFARIKLEDEEQFFLHTRMRRPIYDLLFTLMKDSLTKTSLREPICPETRLALTLTYLSQGVSHQFLAWSFKLGKTTVRKIILETCELLWQNLAPIYVTEPTRQQYENIAKDFWEIWNMPNCVGAIDGKHVNIICPANSGSQFYNYKHFFSIVLLAICDAKYTFTGVSVGSFGSQSDGGVLQESDIGKRLLSGELPLPPDRCLPGTNELFPHYFVGDAAFPLKRNLMRPFPGKLLTREKRIYNYRLSRARRLIENSFGILVARWRILRTRIECQPENAERIVLAAIVLHNFIMLNDQQRWYCPPTFVDWEDEHKQVREGEWRNVVNNDGGCLKSFRPNIRNAPATAFSLRNKMANYFLTTGAVPFQERLFSV